MEKLITYSSTKYFHTFPAWSNLRNYDTTKKKVNQEHLKRQYIHWGKKKKKVYMNILFLSDYYNKCTFIFGTLKHWKVVLERGGGKKETQQYIVEYTVGRKQAH